MAHANSWLAFESKLRDAYPGLSDREYTILHYQYQYISCECADSIPTDIHGKHQPDYRCALTGRYWILRRLQDDPEYWDENHELFAEVSSDLPHEPAIIAAALAIRPSKRLDWDVVEDWSWVYRHALMLDVVVDDFECWCADQTPEGSRATVLTELMRCGRVDALSGTEGLTIFDIARGNA